MELESNGVDAVEREGGGGRRGMGTLATEVDLGGYKRKQVKGHQVTQVYYGKGSTGAKSIQACGKGLKSNKLSFQHTSGGAIAVGPITAMELRELTGLLPLVGADTAIE